MISEQTFFNPYAWGEPDYFHFRADMFEEVSGERHQVAYDEDGLTHFVFLSYHA